jgi:uncharacterized protein (TIGR03083 family)
MPATDEVYVETQERLLAAAAAADPATRVPACPDWTVHDVVAHVAGLASDVVNGAMPMFDLLEQWRDDTVADVRDAMTAKQVAARADETVAGIGADWRAVTPALRALMRGETPAGEGVPAFIDMILVTDLTVHEQDVRDALELPAVRDAAGVGIGLATYGFGVGYRITALGLPALRLSYDGKERVLGDGEPGATVTAEKWELFRAFAGRRSRAQIAAYDWTGDAGPYLGLIPAYGERVDDLVEV